MQQNIPTSLTKFTTTVTVDGSPSQVRLTSCYFCHTCYIMFTLLPASHKVRGYTRSKIMLCLQLVSPVHHMQVDQTPPGLQQTEVATKTTGNEAVDTRTVLLDHGKYLIISVGSLCNIW